jgi:hypothetical protein
MVNAYGQLAMAQLTAYSRETSTSCARALGQGRSVDQARSGAEGL